MRILVSGSNLRVVNCTAEELLLNALQVPRRSEGGPSWVRERRFDISANSEDGTPPGELTQMTLQLLRDRFKLAYHVESKETPGLALTVGRKQPNLSPSKDGEPREVIWGAPVRLNKIGMAEFARVLSGWLNMPVVDRTGLAGQFDFMLEPDDIGDTLADRLRSAIEGLGFRFVDEKVKLEYVTIDHAELPGDN